MADKVLLVEDQEPLRLAIREYMVGRGFEVLQAANCEEARRVFAEARPTAVVLDFHLPDGTALDLLPEFKRIDSFTPLILLTAFGSIDLAVDAIKAGADQFLTKPVELSALAVIVQRAIDARRDRQKQLAGRAKQDRESVNPFLGSSAAIRKLEEQTRRVLDAETPVLIQGETGTGKTLLARWIHSNSKRSDEAFVDLNCVGLSRELLETELFGHEKGAFTGAVASKTGLFEVAQRGTVFLDEIGDVDPQIQPKLLKVLEDKQFRRLGDVRDRRVDVRLLAASHQELSQLVREKKFRSDLYFRISTIPLAVPALRERAEDIPFLAETLLHSTLREMGRGPVEFAKEAVEALVSYTWPGNIRELRNVIERAVLLGGGSELTRRDLLFEPASDFRFSDAVQSGMTLEQMERSYIEWTMQQCQGKVIEAAKRLQVPKSTLYQKLKQYKIEGQGSGQEEV